MTLKCAIIDDEPLARECVANYIEKVDFLALAGMCKHPLEYYRITDEHVIDLIFLDIQMPHMNGLEFLRASAKMPMVILTTAFPNYAVEGFELDVMDYLLKPITFNRFFKSVTKVRDRYLLASPKPNEKTDLPPDEAEFIFLKSDNAFKKVYLKQILFIEAMQNFVIFHTTDEQKHITLISLKAVAAKLDPQMFVKVHKSFIVSVSKITSIGNGKVEIGAIKIPLSRNHRKCVMEKVVKNELWKN